MKFQFNFLLLAIASAAVFTSGCSTEDVFANRAPSLSARFVQKWTFADFARDIEGKGADVNVSHVTIKTTDNAVVLVPVPTIRSDAFAEMKQLSQPGDEISEFVDRWDGRYFFCLTRGGHIVKSYEFENHASRV